MNNVIDNLLEPRYKVIADYPMNPFDENEVLYLSEYDDRPHLIKPEWYCIVNSNCYPESYFNSWPHLFKRLQWWEERQLTEMPQYVKDESGEVWKMWEYKNPLISFVLLQKNFKDCEIPYGTHDLYLLLPATKEEYENQNNQL